MPAKNVGKNSQRWGTLGNMSEHMEHLLMERLTDMPEDNIIFMK
jgi:hypothetical protein